jgi:hypothetical protein
MREERLNFLSSTAESQNKPKAIPTTAKATTQEGRPNSSRRVWVSSAPLQANVEMTG